MPCILFQQNRQRACFKKLPDDKNKYQGVIRESNHFTQDNDQTKDGTKAGQNITYLLFIE